MTQHCTIGYLSLVRADGVMTLGFWPLIPVYDVVFLTMAPFM
jgi:hypothetical protein